MCIFVKYNVFVKCPVSKEKGVLLAYFQSYLEIKTSLVRITP